MKYLFLIAAFNTLFFSSLLVQKKPRALHDNILIVWLIFLGVFIGTYSFYSHELFTHFRLLSISLLSLFMIHGPFLYFYILILVSNDRVLQKKDLLHLLPFVCFNLYILIVSFFPQESARLDMSRVTAGGNTPLIFLFFLILTSLSGTVYFILTTPLFRKLDINIFNTYSNSSNIDLYWIRKLVLAFGVIWTALIAITIIHHVFNLFPMVFCTDGLFLSLSVFVILIGYFGLKQKVIFPRGVLVPENHGEEAARKYSGSRLSESDVRTLSETIVRHVEMNKSYLDPDLTLPQLAGEIGISVHVLSQVINEDLNINFFDFINRYRVEAFKKMITDPDFSHFSLLGIAFECGFNSKSAFNRVFRKLAGITPSQYRESILKP